jgi:repressor of nif and glnA expression
MNFLKEHETSLILKIIENSSEPLETKEIESQAKKITRVKILYRLNNLRAEGLIKGKQIGSGKGTWIWWGKNLLIKQKNSKV